MANFYAQYPASSAGSNASVGANGTTAPTSSTEVGGINPSGNLQPLQTDSSGNLLVSLNTDVPNLPVNLVQVDGVAVPTGPGTSTGGTQRVALSSDSSINNITGTVSLPTGASTSANQVTELASLASILSNQTNGSQETSIVGTVPLPTGAATSANQTTMITDLAAIEANQTNGTQTTQVSNFPATQPISAVSLPLPTGAATSALQSNVQSAPGTSATTALTVQGSASGVAIPVTVSSGPAEQNVNLNQVGGSTIAIGQQLSTASLPVVLPATQITALTPLSTVTVTQATAANLNATVVGSGTAGTPATGVVSVQGISGGTAISMTDTTNVDLLMTGAAAQTATVNNILPATSGATATTATGYKSAAVQVNSTGTGGTYIFEQSVDNTNFSTMTVYNSTTVSGTPITGAITASAANIIYLFPVTAPYIRLRIASAITGGSIQAFSRLSANLFNLPVTQATQATGTNLHTVLDSGTLTTVSTVTAVGSINTNADQASAAITTTTTSAAKTLSTGNSLSFTINMTAVSGTTPTYDFVLQTSEDGTNWTNVYQAPRMTAISSWSSPLLQLNGIQYRYIETISGTTPSFTRTITTNRSTIQGQWYRNNIDRTIAPITTNSTTASLFVEGLTNYTAIVNQGAGGTAVTFALDGSVDGTNWVQSLATAVGVVGGATPVAMNYSGTAFTYIRARVVTGVASTTISYLELSATQTTGNLSLATGSSLVVTQPTAGNLNATIIGTTAAGSGASAGLITVQGNAAGTPVPVTVSSSTLPTTPFNGQQTSTGTAVAIASSQALTQGVIVQAKSGNTSSVYIGATGVTTSTGFELQPGQATSVAVSNLNVVFLIAVTSGDGICYIGS